MSERVRAVLYSFLDSGSSLETAYRYNYCCVYAWHAEMIFLKNVGIKYDSLRKFELLNYMSFRVLRFKLARTTLGGQLPLQLSRS